MGQSALRAPRTESRAQRPIYVQERGRDPPCAIAGRAPDAPSYPTPRDNPGMSPDRVRRHLVVHGIVQGVFFRDSTRRCAERHGVAGWARNRPDGTVEAVLEGPRDAVAEVEAFIHHGPPDAHVESVDATTEPPEGLTTFSVS
jgi:acylphosphatase